MIKPRNLYLVLGDDELADNAQINWVILKRKSDPTTRTEVVLKLNGKERHLFMTKIGGVEIQFECKDGK